MSIILHSNVKMVKYTVSEAIMQLLFFEVIEKL